MHATLSPAKADLVQVARAEEALSRLARQAAGKASYRRSRLLPSDFSAAPLVPAVDPTMRSVGNGQDLGGRKLLIGLLAFILMIAGLGAAATWGWQWYGEAAQQTDLSLPPHPGNSSAELIVANPPMSPALPEKQAHPPTWLMRPRSNPHLPLRRLRTRSRLRRSQHHHPRRPSNSRPWLMISPACGNGLSNSPPDKNR